MLYWVIKWLEPLTLLAEARVAATVAALALVQRCSAAVAAAMAMAAAVTVTVAAAMAAAAEAAALCVSSPR